MQKWCHKPWTLKLTWASLSYFLLKGESWKCAIWVTCNIFFSVKSFFQRICVMVRSKILLKPKHDAIILSQVQPFTMFMFCFYLLVLIYFVPGISCGYVNSTTYGSHKAGRTGRFFGLFNIVSFRDDECNSTTQGVRGIIYQ